MIGFGWLVNIFTVICLYGYVFGGLVFGWFCAGMVLCRDGFVLRWLCVGMA